MACRRPVQSHRSTGPLRLLRPDCDLMRRSPGALPPGISASRAWSLRIRFTNESPLLFLAWGERARAVSRRFDVPAPEKGRDVLATIRLWRLAGAPQVASRN